MKSILFCAAGHQFSIGGMTQVTLKTMRSATFDKTKNFVVNPARPNEYGDSIVSVHIPTTSIDDWPLINFRLLNSDGSTGFDITDNAKDLLRPFIQNGYLLVGGDQTIAELGHDGELRYSPLSFSPAAHGLPCPITFHHVDATSLLNFWTQKGDLQKENAPDFWVKALIDSLEHCQYITVWSFASGSNPTVLCKSKHNLITNLRNQLKHSGYELIETIEAVLPEW